MRCLLGFLGGVFLAGAASAQDLAAGREVAGQCRTCHGLHGEAQSPDAPSIGGETAAYLAEQLRAYRSGARQHPRMSIVASSLSEDDIAAVSAWYAAQSVTATLPEGAEAADAPQQCVACHGADGIGTVEGAPNLVGDPERYIGDALEAFASGQRQSETMGPIASALGEDERRAAAEWYSEVTGAFAAPE